jgi:hypothetical protein
MLEFILFPESKETPMRMRRIASFGGLLAMIPALSGCWYVAAAGAGAYGGYKMKEKGYTVQNPVTKEKSEKGEDKEQSK